MDIYLARHGETEYNRIRKLQGRGIDAPINDQGRAQALAIAKHFVKVQPQRVFSSNLKRSKQTAQVIAAHHDIPLISDPDLDEMSFGIYEGQWIKDVKSVLKATHQRWSDGDLDHAMEGGESPIIVRDRAKAAVIRLLKDAQELERVLFVLHGRLLRILVSDLLGYGLHNMHEIPHENGALYHLKWTDNKFKAVDLYITSHLTSLKQEAN